jgi:hypothetical protein
MLRSIIAGLTLVMATFGAAAANETIDPNAFDAGDRLQEVLAAPKADAQDQSARCFPVENRQMTIASARGHGLDIENFSEVETAAFLKAFNALKPESNFVATKMFAAVGRDRAYVFFESGKDLCTTPSPLHRAGYKRLAKRAQGDGA